MRHMMWLASPVSLLILLPYYFYFQFGPKSLHLAFVLAIVGSLLLLAPHLAIHFRHLHLSRSLVFEAAPRAKTYTIKTGTKVVRFDRMEIVEATRFMVRGTSWFAWQDYGYMRIRLASGVWIIISDLVVPIEAWSGLIPNHDVSLTIWPWPSEPEAINGLPVTSDARVTKDA